MNLKRIFCLLTILIFSISVKSSYILAQEKAIEYDSHFIDYIAHKWNLEKYEKQNLEKFKRINAFYNQLKIKNEDILTEYHISKPDNNILIANYLDNKLQWNRFNRGNKKLSTKKVIKKSLKNLPNRNEMLAFYYLNIFSHILNNQRTIEPYEKDLDFKKLDLDRQESSIMFLCAMRFLGNQISGYSSTNFPKNCFRANIFLKKIPTFNGKIYSDFELPDFNDFLIEVDKRYPKVSFKEHYIPIFEKSKEDFTKCIKK